MKFFTVQDRLICLASGSRVQPSTLAASASASSRESAGTPPSQGVHRLLGSSFLCRRVHRDGLLGSRAYVQPSWVESGRLSEALALAGKSPLGDVGDVGGDRGADLLAELGVVPDELGPELLDQPQHVVDDQDLAVAMRAGADADGGDGQSAR